MYLFLSICYAEPCKVGFKQDPRACICAEAGFVQLAAVIGVAEIHRDNTVKVVRVFLYMVGHLGNKPLCLSSVVLLFQVLP